MATPKFFNLILFLVVAVAAISTASANIDLHFYFTETYNGTLTTAPIVARLNNTSGFGEIGVNDNFLVDKLALGGTIIGEIEGFTVATSLDGTDFTTTQNIFFTAGAYNGSSVTAVGWFSTDNTITSEIPIVGGTGRFRFARGYSLSRTLFANANFSLVEVNLRILL